MQSVWQVMAVLLFLSAFAQPGRAEEAAQIPAKVCYKISLSTVGETTTTLQIPLCVDTHDFRYYRGSGGNVSYRPSKPYLTFASPHHSFTVPIDPTSPAPYPATSLYESSNGMHPWSWYFHTLAIWDYKLTQILVHEQLVTPWTAIVVPSLGNNKIQFEHGGVYFKVVNDAGDARRGASIGEEPILAMGFGADGKAYDLMLRISFDKVVMPGEQ